MLNNRNKKSIEKLHLEYFKERCKELPLRADDDDYGENPDFLRKHSSGVLGVELTQLFKVTNHPNAPQALESFRQQIVESAQKLCEKDIPPLLVKVWFNFNQVVPKNRKPEIKRIGRVLAKSVKKWHRENPSEFHRVLRPPSEIPATFLMVSITRIHSHQDWAVITPAYQLNYFPIYEIQCCIDGKNRRYEQYLKKCDECWLLIVIDIFKDSQSFEMHDQEKHRFESKFERVFYMDASHRKDLLELHINRLKDSL